MRLYLLREVVSRDLKVEWVWGNRIPRGYVTLLGAKGGTGKSGFALWLANKLAGEGKKILYVDAEHTLKHISERAKSWGLNAIDNIGIIASEDETEPDESKRILESDFPGFVKTAEIARAFEAELVIVDSLTAISAGRNLKDEKEAVIMMKELREMALSVNGAVLLLCHTKKPILKEDFVVTADEIAGSHAIVDMARSVLLMTVDEYNPKVKLIRHGKCNFSAPAPDIEFTMDENGVYDFKEIEPAAAFRIEQGTKMEKYYKVGLDAARDGKSKREIRSAVKDIGGSEVEATRVVAWLKEKHNICFDKTIL